VLNKSERLSIVALMEAADFELLVEEFYNKRQSGIEFSELRKELEDSGLRAEEVAEILAEVNERELNNLAFSDTQINPKVFLFLGIATLLSGLGLAYFLNSIAVDANYQLLNAIPVAGSLVLFYNYYNQKNRSRRGR